MAYWARSGGLELALCLYGYGSLDLLGVLGSRFLAFSAYGKVIEPNKYLMHLVSTLTVVLI